ncbi:MAG: trimeric autotransporter adhesin [Actinomycetota bacterium]|jgi:alpha-tubulin suppressor-like RCC1 family protein/sugar lactone lactonase YvrE|nr:trimeric autotransporter adhesin [Actinomycetota bacterium]
MSSKRRSVAALGVVVAVLIQLLGRVPGAASAEPTLERVAGTIGDGLATDVGQRPTGIAVHGTTLYIADGDGTNVVRALDLNTGQERIVAGTTAGPRRDNVPATTSALNEPVALATDGAGNLYIAEGGLVRKLATNGIISTVAGSFTYKGVTGGDGGPATGVQLDPQDVAVDATGNLYIADYFGHRVRKVNPAGIITTVAGTGGAGFSGDGGPATAAQINRPYGVAVDAQGNLYVSDSFNYRVRKVDTAGTITTFAGTGSKSSSGDGGPATAATLADPRDIAFDRDGNVYIADTYGYHVRKVDASGTISTVAGNGWWGTEGDGGPALAAQLLAFDLAFDAADNLYVADSWLDKVRRIDRQGVITRVAGNGFTHFSGDGGPAVDAQVHGIQRLAVDPVSGRLAFADSGSKRVRTIDAAGVVSTIYTGPGYDFWIFSGLAYDPYGNLYVGERGRIRRIDRNGAITVVAGTGEGGFSGDGGLATLAQMQIPSSLTFDRAGNLYFNDRDNGRIRKVSPLGIITTVAGTGVDGLSGDGGPATAAKIWPWYGAEVAVDDAGNLYLADSYNDRIRKVDPSGTITSVGAGQVDFPTGLAFDGAGSLFVASASDSKVRRMTPAGAWSTVAGNGTYGFAGEGGPATSAELAIMGKGMGGDVAVDQNGTLFIGGFQRIWKVGGVATPVTFPTLPPTSTTTSTTSTTTTTTVPAGTAAWGLNHAGQAGQGASAGSAAAVAVAGAATGQTAVAAGWYHSLAVNPGGTVSAWGWNYYGQLGDGSTVTRTAPVAVPGLTGVTAVAAGVAHSLALKSDGTVWAWGMNGYGQLGDGTTTDRRTPQEVPGLTGVVAVAAGGYHSLALKADGTVWAWGWNGAGSLGDGTTTDRSTPTPVALPPVSSIAAGANHSLAVISDGTVRAWGWNAFGQLGSGTTTRSAVPLAIPGLSGVQRVAGGGDHSLALMADGTVRSWGWNGVGQLGDGTTVDRLTPVAVSGLSGMAGVAAGYAHSVAVKADGMTSAWGWNYYGQLGNGTTTTATAPVAVTGLGHAGTVAAGATHTLAAGVRP